MLLHSRQGSGEHQPVDINALVEESLNLAYHGARAEKQGFNITLERSLDPAAGKVDLFPQEITRVSAQPDFQRLLRGDQAQGRRPRRQLRADANGLDQEVSATAWKSEFATTAPAFRPR